MYEGYLEILAIVSLAIGVITLTLIHEQHNKKNPLLLIFSLIILVIGAIILFYQISYI